MLRQPLQNPVWFIKNNQKLRPTPWWAVWAALGLVVVRDAEVVFTLVLVAVALVGRRWLRMEVQQRLWTTAAALSALQYLQIRFFVVNWSSAWIGVPLLLAELLGLVHMLGFLGVQWLKPGYQPRSGHITPTTLYVLIPTTSEGRAILKTTVRAVQAAAARLCANVPMMRVEIVICNDGYVTNYPAWREAERLAAQVDVRCITRREAGGAKAGNLQNAWDTLGIGDEALVAVFDADHTPHPDFFLVTLPHFVEADVGWVQTGQYYRNLDNLIANWANQQMLLFYDNLCTHKAAQDALFLCGTNFVIRARALNEIGGIPTASPTEDFAASLPMHLNGWRSVYRTERLSSGLGPMDIQSYLRQQSRWARGCLMVMRDYWRPIFLPWVRGFGFGQRFQYFLSGTHYLGGLRDLTFVATPVIFMLMGVSAVRTDSFTYIIAFTLYWAVGMAAAAWHMVAGISIWRVNMMSFGCFPVLVRSFQRVLVQDFQPFDVTSKQRLLRGNWPHLIPHMLFLAAIVVAVAIGGQYHSAPLPDVLVNGFWLVYSAANLIGFIVLGLLSDRQATNSENPP